MIPGFWRDRRVLVTGHTGFKGAWLAMLLEQLGARVSGIGLASEAPDGVHAAVSPWNDLTHHEIDLRDADAVRHAVRICDPTIVFHLAAQSLVPRGYAEPAATYAVNVIGTVHLLDALRESPSMEAVVVVTSDKVYANSGDGRAFVESDPLGGHDPYSNSKAMVEMLVGGWREAYGERCQWSMATARAGNVIGGGDRAPDRLVPDAMRALARGRPIPLRHPEASRPWQHVLDPLSGYLLLAEHLAAGGLNDTAFNFGPALDDPSVPVHQVVERVCSLWGSGSWNFVPSTTGKEMPVLRLDSSLATAVLGWRPQLDLDEALHLTVEWYRHQRDGSDMRVVSIDQLMRFEKAGVP